MSNIREVAQAAGVSVATVSRALANPEKVSEESLKKVHDAIKVVGYRPNLLARSFRSAKSFCVVVLVPDITNPFFSQVIQAIEDRAQQRGYAVLLGDTRETSKREQESGTTVEKRVPAVARVFLVNINSRLWLFCIKEYAGKINRRMYIFHRHLTDSP